GCLGVGVAGGVCVAAAVAVGVAVTDAEAVAVDVGVAVTNGVPVAVGVAVTVAVGVGVTLAHEPIDSTVVEAAPPEPPPATNPRVLYKAVAEPPSCEKRSDGPVRQLLLPVL